MKLASLLTNNQVLLDLKGEVCADAITEIIEHLIARSLIEESLHDEIIESLKEREQQISTGIGSGVAIPHAFSENIDQVVACFARSKNGVDFESLDNAPVNFIVLFVVPQKDYNMHLQTLAAIAKLFNNCEIRQKLHEAETADDVLAIFASRPSRTHCER